jgi:methylase of polypeptide subunit release factors
MTDQARISWDEQGQEHSARWHSESGWPAPKKVVLADDTMPADVAYRLALDGTALLWRGDFQNARQMLQALVRRIEHKGARVKKPKAPAAPAELFHRHRLTQLQRARTLSMLLIELQADYSIALRRAPDVHDACVEAYGDADGAQALDRVGMNAHPTVISLRELLGLIGAHEWRRKGVPVPALEARIHPWYGVFSPVRGEYIDLVAQAPLPANAGLAFDVGTGTGVLAALLAWRGVAHVVATDMDARALGCARENIERLGFAKQVEIIKADLFPEGRAPLIVCNPPWLPGKPSSSIEHAIYDPDSRMLRAYLGGLAAHLAEGGEGWLVLSDLAEHLQLRSREQLLGWIAAAGLTVLGRHDTRPVHGKASDQDDPLHAARSREVTSLWRLGVG